MTILPLDSEDTRPVPATDEIRNHPLSTHFIKWLGDHRLPVDHVNYPRVFGKFLRWTAAGRPA